MDWHRIRSQQDADELMKVFNGFRNCVLTELDYLSGAYVQPALAMYPINAKRRVRMVFQRQDKNLPAIELVFCDTSRLNLVPIRTNCTAEITGAVLAYQGGRLYWADRDDFVTDNINKDPAVNQATWIEAKRAQWRVLKDHLGAGHVYEVTK